MSLEARDGLRDRMRRVGGASSTWFSEGDGVGDREFGEAVAVRAMLGIAGLADTHI